MPDFFETPILNSPYGYPGQHWQLDDKHQPLNIIEPARRRSQLMTPIPATKKQKASGKQREMSLYATDDSETQEYNDNPVINEIRGYVETWRNLPNPEQWQVTPETARLLKHWRHHDFQNQRPFFCQIEAVETAIWLTEVASKNRPRYRRFLDLLDDANRDANPELYRLALKLATGAGKTTVMAMLIAWQAVNAVRHPGSKQFSKAFLIITPGITIRDRLQVLLPSDPESYFRTRELIPPDMLRDLESAKIVITNYHAFRLREKLEISRVGRALLQGAGDPIETIETEGEMLRRVMPDLMGTKGIVVLNDEAHHCYREKPRGQDEGALTGEEKAEAEENNKAARLWISGIEAVKRKMGVNAVFDLSATPFFLRGSGYAEGTLFPWTVSDFSLMDAIECGIVKLPRIPVSDNMTDDEPRFRNLWENIRKEMPKKGRGGGKGPTPESMPDMLQSALFALYGHYEGEFARWEEAGIPVPPVFIVVCNNTSTSKLVYDWIAGYQHENPDGSSNLRVGNLELFRNHGEQGNLLSRPRTLLIDSSQLESGDSLDASFREAAGPEIEQFRRDLIERKKDARAGDNVTDQDLLREVMNTVGKEGRLGEQVRCVVSVSMLTEGWDANTVTHILGIRAFGTQLLCEQVVGRALRRQSYRLNDQGLFDVEYADVLGIPFDFASKVVATKSAPPVKTIRVKALAERAGLAITFPRVQGYRTDVPRETLRATFNEDSTLDLTPELIGPTSTQNQGILGKSVDLTLERENRRPSTVSYELTKHLLGRYRDENGEICTGLFHPLQRVVRSWLEGGYLRCSPGLTASNLIDYPSLRTMACNKIENAIRRGYEGDKKVLAIIDPYNPAGSTRFVNFTTSKPTRLTQRSHVNLVTLDSDWEAVMCHVLDLHPRVHSYVKNQNLGFEVPYLDGAKPRRYLPDFIVQVDDGKPDPLNLIVEVKGYRGEDAKAKADTMHTYWVPGVNNLGSYGRWAFYEFRDPWTMQHELAARIEPELNKLLDVFAEGKEPAHAS